MKSSTAKPSPATRAALVALLKSDSAITATHRARILAAFDASTNERPKGWLPASAVAKSLSLSLSTVMLWADGGRVEARRVGDRLTLVNQEEVAAYAAAHPRRGSRLASAPGDE